MASDDLDIEGTVLARKSSGRLRLVLGLAVAALLAALGAWWWLARGEGGEQGYVTAPVTRADVTVVVTATGTVEPTDSVGISSGLSGTVDSVEVDFNDPVKKGQVLARLDTSRLEATLEHSRAMLAAAEARLALAKATLEEARRSYERTAELRDRGIASDETFQATLAAFRRAEASVQSAEADRRVAASDLKVKEADLADACICSPIDGIVLDRSIDVGQIVVSSFQAPVLFTLAEDLDHMELRVDIDEADIGKVALEDAATFTVEAFPERTFPARIAELRYAPQTIDGVVTYEAILTLDNSEGLLRPGMTAVAEIVVQQVEDALVIPNAALRYAPAAETEEGRRSGLLGMLFSRAPSNAPVSEARQAGGSRTVWVLRGGAPAAAEIVTGPTDGLVTVVESGPLAEGDAVITDAVAAR